MRFAAVVGVGLIGGLWAGVFLLAGKAASPVEAPKMGVSSREVVEHFEGVADNERRREALGNMLSNAKEPGRVQVILEGNITDPIPVRFPVLDGFLCRYVNIARGDGGVASIFGLYSRAEPYLWPRVLDVEIAPKQTIRADLDERRSSEKKAVYRLAGGKAFEMVSPNGMFQWTLTKDSNELNGSGCLFRQDLYKDGEYFKSLAAMSTVSH
jgi:hypothetical protein